MGCISGGGASILGFGYLIPVVYLLWSLKRGAISGPNPWHASGLEWEIPSPPPTENFTVTPRVHDAPYLFTAIGSRESNTA